MSVRLGVLHDFGQNVRKAADNPCSFPGFHRDLAPRAALPFELPATKSAVVEAVGCNDAPMPTEFAPSVFLMFNVVGKAVVERRNPLAHAQAHEVNVAATA